MEAADLLLVEGGPHHLIQNVAYPDRNSRVVKKEGVIYKNTLQLKRG